QVVEFVSGEFYVNAFYLLLYGVAEFTNFKAHFFYIPKPSISYTYLSDYTMKSSHNSLLHIVPALLNIPLSKKTVQGQINTANATFIAYCKDTKEVVF